MKKTFSQLYIHEIAVNVVHESEKRGRWEKLENLAKLVGYFFKFYSRQRGPSLCVYR